ncbi:MAG: LysM peptidoglycan-binding domain-containing protein [Candidatus Polarisedimenticolaceae bacterium]|nr:LysM peptidoglycan-binding domain-containing protein [Candidatus Polarisedimenticolaceae bacterium]
MSYSVQKIAGLLLGLLLSTAAFAAPVELNSVHPERYTVVRGDTLWDISARFLRDPWHWPDVWQANSQIENPHLIYPGDVIALSFIDGAPVLRVERAASRDLKLSPKVRSELLDQAIPTIPIDAIAQFLTRPYVLDKGELDDAPYVVHFLGDHIIGGAGHQIYVRAITEPQSWKYEVVRPGKPYIDPITDEILGYEALFVGNADLQRTGDPAKLLLTKTEMETVIGDRLMPIITDEPLTNFQPKAPETLIEGQIISVLNGVSQIGQYHTVVLNRGSHDGLAPGHVLRILQGGEEIRDIVNYRRSERIKLPLEEAGILMVYRTFERVSFGLVMYATDSLHVNDTVRTPGY